MPGYCKACGADAPGVSPVTLHQFGWSVQPDGWVCPVCRGANVIVAGMEKSMRDYTPEDFTPLVSSLPHQLQSRVDEWLKANEKRKEGLLHGIFPLGMVQRWIERAEKAEAELRKRATVG